MQFVHFICRRPVDDWYQPWRALDFPRFWMLIFLGMFEPAPNPGQVSGACVFIRALPERSAAAGGLTPAARVQLAICHRQVRPSNALEQGLQSPCALFACRLCWSGRAL